MLCASCTLPLLVSFFPEKPLGCCMHGCDCSAESLWTWAVSESVLSLLALVPHSAATTLSSGKPHAFLPVGGSRRFVAGAHGMSVYVPT